MRSSKLLSLAFVALIIMVSRAGAIVYTPPRVKEGSGSWEFAPNTGVSAMHMVNSGPTKMLIIDKAEKNPDAKRKNGLFGFSTEYDLTATSDPAFRVLDLASNTFCSAGSYLGNGTLIETGGSDADAGTKASSGFQSIRIWQPCTDGTCDWMELPLYMKSARWYNSMVTLPDGRVFILGGCTNATSINTVAYQNPTYEFYPSDNGTQSAPFEFLTRAFPYDLYPHIHVLPYGTQLFLFSSTHAAIWDYSSKKFVNDKIPDVKGSPKTYPLTGSGLLLPLTYENDYKPEFLICGGGTKYRDTKATADNNCGRIDLSAKNPTWDYDTFVIPRVMGDSIILPDGKVFFVNGGGKGYAGYTKGSAPNFVYLSDDPVLTPLLYDPNAEKGKRWTKLANSSVPRMYHSAASLIPDGRVMVAGSNPNGNYRTSDKGLKYPTEYRVEMFSPPYLQNGVPRPKILKFAGSTLFNKQNPIRITYGSLFTIRVKLPAGVKPEFRSSIINLGFQTHSMHMSQRYVELKVGKINPVGDGIFRVNIHSPPRANVMPPGRSYVYFLHRGTPADTAVEVMLGDAAVGVTLGGTSVEVTLG